MITDERVALNCQCQKIRSAARKISRIYDDALRPVGLKANQFTILIAISLLGPVSITNLAEKLSMERTTLTRNLRPLEKSGFLKLLSGVGRTRNIIITTKGKAAVALAKPEWDKVQKVVTKRIGKQNLKSLNNALEVLAQN